MSGPIGLLHFTNPLGRPAAVEASEILAFVSNPVAEETVIHLKNGEQWGARDGFEELTTRYIRLVFPWTVPIDPIPR